MKSNVCGIERTLRFVIGILLLLAGTFVTFDTAAWLDGVLLVIGVVLVATAAIQFCPLNLLLGINTCEQKK